VHFYELKYATDTVSDLFFFFVFSCLSAYYVVYLLDLLFGSNSAFCSNL
jgi:hypothetical protein